MVNTPQQVHAIEQENKMQGFSKRFSTPPAKCVLYSDGGRGITCMDLLVTVIEYGRCYGLYLGVLGSLDQFPHLHIHLDLQNQL